MYYENHPSYYVVCTKSKILDFLTTILNSIIVILLSMHVLQLCDCCGPKGIKSCLNIKETLSKFKCPNLKCKSLHMLIEISTLHT